jgi:hypothetical protein
MRFGIALLLIAAVLFVVAILLSRRRKALEAELGLERTGRKRAIPPPPPPGFDVVRPRPSVAEFHVEGDKAKVRFDVPLPETDDEVLSELLVDEAIEVVREKRHTLPLAGLTEVVVLAGRGEVRQVGKAKLDPPGHLPPKSEVYSILNLSAIAADPLSRHDEAERGPAPETVFAPHADELVPLAQEIRLPKAVATGLRAQGIDPMTMSAAELVTGLLRLFGYSVSATGAGGWFAVKNGEKTYIVEDRYRPGDHPELDEHAIRRFVVEFASSGAQRGLLVSEKYSPFEVYEVERRDPRVRFVTRERLQKMVESLSLS